LIAGGSQVAHLPQQRPLLQRPHQGQLQCIGIGGFQDVVGGAGLDAFHGRGDGALAREHQHRQVGKRRVQPAHQLETVHAGHLQVGEHQVHGRPAQVVLCLGGAAGEGYVEAARFQQLPERRAHIRFVFHHQHGSTRWFHLSHPCAPVA
jgi:hypothetical protein